MANFNHYDLQLLNPTLASPLMDVITELEHLRRLEMSGTTPYPVFLQLKRVFHILESLASARIEGNHTTLADYIESKVTAPEAPSDALHEMENIEKAMQHIEDSIQPGDYITEVFIRGLHGIAVDGLEREGDLTPGAYRAGQVRINAAEHLPPEAVQVPGYMTELVTFVNRDDPRKYDLMKVALAHHRFAWIHPFGNGNGRVVRLLTYALLIKYGFRVNDVERILNPAAVFCADRDHYYAMLAQADRGADDDLEAWCRYVLAGVLEELNKVAQLADYAYLQDRVLLPAVAHARDRQLINEQEALVLAATVKGKTVKSGDLADALPGLSQAQRTYQIRKLVEQGMLAPISEGARQYTIGFSNNMLLRGVVRALTEQGFIPAALNAPAIPPAPQFA